MKKIVLTLHFFSVFLSAYGDTYELLSGGAIDGAKIYTDRDYVYDKVPESLLGSDLILTTVADRDSSASTSLFEVTLSRPATVHVGFDSRAKRVPRWLQSWQKTGETALAAKHLKMELYSKDLPAGTVAFKGCGIPGLRAMYVILAAKHSVKAVKRVAPTPDLDKPNILWLTSEDNSAEWLGCYGNKLAQTANIDKLAKEGFRYTNTFCNSPVCSPTRGSWITGVHAVSLGIQAMRSFSKIPDSIPYYPDLMKKRGYYTGN